MERDDEIALLAIRIFVDIGASLSLRHLIFVMHEEVFAFKDHIQKFDRLVKPHGLFINPWVRSPSGHCKQAHSHCARDYQHCYTVTFHNGTSLAALWRPVYILLRLPLSSGFRVQPHYKVL